MTVGRSCGPFVTSISRNSGWWPLCVIWIVCLPGGASSVHGVRHEMAERPSSAASAPAGLVTIPMACGGPGILACTVFDDFGPGAGGASISGLVSAAGAGEGAGAGSAGLVSVVAAGVTGVSAAFDGLGLSVGGCGCWDGGDAACGTLDCALSCRGVS